MNATNTLFDQVINGQRYTIRLVILSGKFQAQEHYCIDSKEYSKSGWTQCFHEARATV